MSKVAGETACSSPEAIALSHAGQEGEGGKEAERETGQGRLDGSRTANITGGPSTGELGRAPRTPRPGWQPRPYPARGALVRKSSSGPPRTFISCIVPLRNRRRCIFYSRCVLAEKWWPSSPAGVCALCRPLQLCLSSCSSSRCSPQSAPAAPTGRRRLTGPLELLIRGAWAGRPKPSVEEGRGGVQDKSIKGQMPLN